MISTYHVCVCKFPVDWTAFYFVMVTHSGRQSDDSSFLFVLAGNDMLIKWPILLLEFAQWFIYFTLVVQRMNLNFGFSIASNQMCTHIKHFGLFKRLKWLEFLVLTHTNLNSALWFNFLKYVTHFHYLSFLLLLF